MVLKDPYPRLGEAVNHKLYRKRNDPAVIKARSSHGAVLLDRPGGPWV
jgi:hypothetical protein